MTQQFFLNSPLCKSCYNTANKTAHTPWPRTSDNILIQVMEFLTPAHISGRRKALRRRDSLVAAQTSNQTASGKKTRHQWHLVTQYGTLEYGMQASSVIQSLGNHGNSNKPAAFWDTSWKQHSMYPKVDYSTSKVMCMGTEECSSS